MILVIDVGPMMDNAPPTGDTTTPLEYSLRIANQIVIQKVCHTLRETFSCTNRYLPVQKTKSVWSCVVRPRPIMSWRLMADMTTLV